MRTAASLGLFALLLFGPAAATLGSHFQFALTGIASTPLWWDFAEASFTHADGAARFIIRDIPRDAVVRLTATPRTFTPVQVHAWPGDGAAPATFLLDDPAPTLGPDMRTLTGPGTWSILVDPGASGPYHIDLDVRAGYGEADGAPATIDMTAPTPWTCPVPLGAACPP